MNAAIRPATHARHYASPPQLTDPTGAKHWITRAANFVVVMTEADAGAVLERSDQPDEYMVLALPGAPAEIEWRDARLNAAGDSLTIAPPGPSRVTMKGPGRIVRIFSSRAADLARAAINTAAYADGAPEVARPTPWPDPVGGRKLRHYRLDRIASPDPSPLKMRVFRSTNLMVNIFMPWTERRDESKLSPHSHDDFEQISIGLQGSFVHHLRYPWTADKRSWRDDEHEFYDSPATMVIPARVIHTSQDVGDGTTRLVDVFGPPRMDFSAKPGFVLNADEYPMPAGV